MPRFVILHHETPPSSARPAHWDFMLECGGVLRTWALAEPPSPGRESVTEELAHHRRAYLDYEGEVSGGRGTVSRWDEGTYEALSDLAAESQRLAPEAERKTPTIRLLVRGQKIAGEIVLMLMP